jgi:hypothetical protein
LLKNCIANWSTNPRMANGISKGPMWNCFISPNKRAADSINIAKTKNVANPNNPDENGFIKYNLNNDLSASNELPLLLVSFE